MKISINEPCHENWDKMAPNDKGAFCLSCKKNVVDFSQKTIEEVKSFFVELPSCESVCGRFKETQLDEMSFNHFLSEFMSWKFIKRAAVICFMIFGTTLFSSCSDEDEHVIGKMEVMRDTAQMEKCIRDTLNKEMITMGKPAIIKDTCEIRMGQATINEMRKSHLMGNLKVIKDTAEATTFIKGDVAIDKKK